MQIRMLLVVVVVVCVTAAWSAKKLDPNTLIALSDARYYFPVANGVTDLAVDLRIDQAAMDPIIKQAQVSYYYAGAARQGFIITGLTDQQAKKRDELQALVSPLDELIMPRPNADAYKGLTLRASRTYRSIADLPSTNFYLLTVLPADEKSDVKEFRILIDEQGLAHQLERVPKDGGSLVAKVNNIQIGEHWHIASITTRLSIDRDWFWKTDAIEYGNVDGYMLPTKITTSYRNNYGRAVAQLPEITYTFVNYRLNKGVAAETLGETAP